MKKQSILTITLFTVLSAGGLVSCGGEPVSFVNTLETSICGKITNYKVNGVDLKDGQSLRNGDKLSFKVTPAEDYNLGNVTVENQGVTKMATQDISIGAGFFSVTLGSGVNKITPTYLIDTTKDFVEDFKLPISDADFTEVMKAPDQSTTFDLREDGIEQMMTAYTDPSEYFINYVDGDTTHFTTRNYGYTAKARYLGIDTRESTSEIEEWGKSASIFNKEKLSSAKHIICHGQIEEETVNPTTGKTECTFNVTTDGNQRNLLYVWYSDKETPVKDDFKCLNLQMTYEGYSEGIGSQEDMGTYFYRYFDKANKSAIANKKHIYTDKYQSDPNYYYGLPVETTIKEIYTTSSGKGETDSPKKDGKTLYRVKGYVSRKINGAFYFQDKASYDQTTTRTPEAYGMYVFTYAQTDIAVGDYIEVIGVLSEYGGNYQMQGISYHDIDPDPNRDTRILSRNNKIVPIELTIAEFFSARYDAVLVKLSEQLFCKDVTNTYGSLCEGGSEEINKYNTHYPFYNTSNKIVMFASNEANKSAAGSLKDNNTMRLQVDENVLISYKESSAYSPKFFVGGTYDYNFYGAQYANYNDDNPFKDETITKTFTAKKFNLVCISQNYISTSGSTKKYSAVIANKADLTSMAEWN